MKPPKILETPRLRLRPPVLDDAAAIFTKYAHDREVTKYLMWRPHQNLEETKDFLRRCLAVWEHGPAFPWVITRKEDHQLLGMIEIRLEGFKAEVGYVLAKPYWNQGYITEAVQAMVDWALKQKEIYRVAAFCDVENLASARVMEKVGMQKEGVLGRWVMHPNRSNKPRDCYCYAICK
jgi:RimJ/RimL family protein N-acetyltransferase